MFMTNKNILNFSFVIIYAISLIISIYFLNKFTYSKNNFYIILILIVFFFNFLIFFIHRSNLYVLKINILIFLFLFVISSYFIEGIFFLKKYHFYKTQLEPEIFNAFSDYKVVASLNDKDDLSKHVDFLPLGLIPNYKTKLCYEEGYWAKYISDNYGFRNSKEKWNLKKLDILFLGDSFGISSCVNDEDEMAYLLNKRTSKEVLNLSLSGTGPLRQYASFLEYGKQKEPKKIIWFFYEGNDFHDIDNELTSPVLLKYLNDQNYSQDLKNRENEIINFFQKHTNGKKQKFKETQYIKVYIKQFLKLYEIRSILNSKLNLKLSTKDKNRIDNSSYYYEHIEIYKNILLKVKSISNNWSGDIIIVYIPSLELFENKKYYEVNIKLKDDLFNFWQKENIRVIDLFKIFKNNQNPSSFFNQEKNLHYKKETYSLIVNEIIDLIQIDN